MYDGKVRSFRKRNERQGFRREGWVRTWVWFFRKRRWWGIVQNSFSIFTETKIGLLVNSQRYSGHDRRRKLCQLVKGEKMTWEGNRRSWGVRDLKREWSDQRGNTQGGEDSGEVRPHRVPSLEPVEKINWGKEPLESMNRNSKEIYDFWMFKFGNVEVGSGERV